MSQLAAYQLHSPKSINLPALEQEAQAARQREINLSTLPGKAALVNAQNANALNEENAIGDFVAKSEAGDPNAVEELRGYPDKYKAHVQAFDAMDPEDWREAKIRGNAFAEAARRVKSLPSGSKEQKAMWDQVLGELQAAGHIDKSQHDAMVSAGPSDDIINEALDIGEFVNTYKPKAPKPLTELDKVRIQDVGIDNARADRKAEADITRADKKTQAQIDQGDRRVKVSEQNASSLGDYRLGIKNRGDKKLEADIADDNADNARADKNVESQIKTREAKGGKGSLSGVPGRLDEKERGRRLTQVEKQLAKEQSENNLTPAQVTARRQELRKAYEVPPAGTPEDPFFPTSPADAANYPVGTYFTTPDGRLIRKK